MTDAPGFDIFFGVNADPHLGAEEQGILFTHSVDKCLGRACCIHHPSDHHMKAWPTVWRGDRQLMERKCEHGVGHPDPDHLAYVRTVDPEKASADSIHGCDGCCGKYRGIK